MLIRIIFYIVVVLNCAMCCLAHGRIVLLNGPPCVGKSTTALELQKLLPGSEIINFDEVQKEAIIELGIKFGLFTAENQQGPDKKYGYQGLSHFIQYVCEHKLCTDQEIQELHNLRLRPFEKISTLAQKGTTVLFDGVISQSNSLLAQCIDMLRGNTITFVLLYLPFEPTAKRYAQSTRRSHGILHVFGYNFPWFYRSAEDEHEPVLEQLSYQKIVSVIQNLDPTIPLLLREQCVKEVIDRFQLQEKDQVILTPRMKYDLIIDVQELSVADCAKKIAEHLAKDRDQSTVFFDNAVLPSPSNLNTLQIVPKLSPKYLEQTINS